MLQKYIGIILVGIFGFCKGVNGENTLCLKSEIVLKKPGNAAKPCAKPMSNEVFKSTSVFFASIFLDLYSL